MCLELIKRSKAKTVKAYKVVIFDRSTGQTRSLSQRFFEWATGDHKACVYVDCYPRVSGYWKTRRWVKGDIVNEGIFHAFPELEDAELLRAFTAKRFRRRNSSFSIRVIPVTLSGIIWLGKNKTDMWPDIDGKRGVGATRAYWDGTFLE